MRSVTVACENHDCATSRTMKAAAKYQTWICWFLFMVLASDLCASGAGG